MMEGTWGRRVYGCVQRGERNTKFYLILETREGKMIYQGFFAGNADLEQYPAFYGEILDMLVVNIEQALERIQQ
jgi:hypothetical protein